LAGVLSCGVVFGRVHQLRVVFQKVRTVDLSIFRYSVKIIISRVHRGVGLVRDVVGSGLWVMSYGGLGLLVGWRWTGWSLRFGG